MYRLAEEQLDESVHQSIRHFQNLMMIAKTHFRYAEPTVESEFLTLEPSSVNRKYNGPRKHDDNLNTEFKYIIPVVQIPVRTL